jgi:hypothetical protein
MCGVGGCPGYAAGAKGALLAADLEATLALDHKIELVAAMVGMGPRRLPRLQAVYAQQQVLTLEDGRLEEAVWLGTGMVTKLGEVCHGETLSRGISGD